MDHTRLVYVVVGLLAATAVGISAATLTDTTDSSRGATGVGGSSDPIELSSEEAPAIDLGSLRVVFYVVMILGAALTVYAALNYPRHVLVEFGKTVFALAVVLGILWVAMQLMTSGSAPQGFGSMNESSLGGGLGGGGEGSVEVGGEDAGVPVAPDVALVAVLALVVMGVGAAGLVLRRRRRDADDDEDVPARDAGEALRAIGRSAGRLAKRLESDVDADNEVYRAWKEMTATLDLDRPQSRTPGEFRAAAVEAGLAAEDVDALTELFEEVRYGGSRPSDEREQQAVEALRRIERRYAEGEQ